VGKQATSRARRSVACEANGCLSPAPAAVIAGATGTAAAVSSTRSRTSTIWIAPVDGCASIRRRSAQA